MKPCQRLVFVCAEPHRRPATIPPKNAARMPETVHHIRQGCGRSLGASKHRTAASGARRLLRSISAGEAAARLQPRRAHRGSGGVAVRHLASKYERRDPPNIRRRREPWGQIAEAHPAEECEPAGLRPKSQSCRRIDGARLGDTAHRRRARVVLLLQVAESRFGELPPIEGRFLIYMRIKNNKQ
jgi:hypothetical protein